LNESKCQKKIASSPIHLALSEQIRQMVYTMVGIFIPSKEHQFEPWRTDKSSISREIFLGMK